MFASAVKYYNPTTCVAVLRAGREGHSKLWAALTMLRHIQGEEVTCRMIDVCGSVRTFRKSAAAVERKRFEIRRETLAAVPPHLSFSHGEGMVDKVAGRVADERRGRCRSALQLGQEEGFGRRGDAGAGADCEPRLRTECPHAFHNETRMLLCGSARRWDYKRLQCSTFCPVRCMSQATQSLANLCPSCLNNLSSRRLRPGIPSNRVQTPLGIKNEPSTPKRYVYPPKTRIQADRHESRKPTHQNHDSLDSNGLASISQEYLTKAIPRLVHASCHAARHAASGGSTTR